MASPSSSSITQYFRLTLLRVSEVLTEQNVQDLAFLCEDISPARRELLTNAREFFVALQGHDLLHERKVNVLIDWLDELRLLEASKVLKSYREKHLAHDSKEAGMCLVHPEQTMKYFCLSCDIGGCPDCFIRSHNKPSECDVFKLDDVSKEVCNHREMLLRELESLEERSAQCEQLWTKKKTFFEAYRNKIRKTINDDYMILQKKIEEHRITLLEKLNEKELSDVAELIREREDIESQKLLVERFRKSQEITAPRDTLNDLRSIVKTKNKLKNITRDFIVKEEKYKGKAVELYYEGIPNNGVFGSLTVSMFIGGVQLGYDQVLHVFDERAKCEGVNLVCVDPKDPGKEYCRRLVKTRGHNVPVVMSYIDMYHDGTNHALFAVGNTVYTVHLHWSGSLYDSVESVSSREMDDVPAGSWISSITTFYPTNGPSDKFWISISGASVLREYKVSGEVLRALDTQDTVLSSGISCVAYCEDRFAILGLDDVILVTYDGKVKQCGSLRPPSSSSGLVPVNVLSTDGGCWLVLFISYGQDKQWKVVKYDETGKLVAVCDEGTSCSDIDVPVSITRHRNTGCVSLVNNTDRIFQI